MSYEYEDDSQVEFASINSPQHDKSIDKSDLTLSKMRFNRSNKTETKSKRKMKMLLLNEVNTKEIEDEEKGGEQAGRDRLKFLMNKYHVTGKHN